MQSPFMGATNPNSPYGAMAHMFLASPPGQSTSGSLPDSHSQLDRPTYQRKATNVIAGVLTPGVLSLSSPAPPPHGHNNNRVMGFFILTRIPQVQVVR